MGSKIQQFQVRFMEIIEDIVDDIPNDKYVDLCKELKDNYEDFEEIEERIEELEMNDRCASRFVDYTHGFLVSINLNDIFKKGLRRFNDDGEVSFTLEEIKERVKNLKCDCCEKNCSSCEEEDYETKYNELVNRIKNTSKTQLQKLKNEL